MLSDKPAPGSQSASRPASAEPASAYAIDGVRLDDIRVPGSIDELRELMAEANARRRPVVSWGGGTQMGLGNVLAESALVVDLRQLSAVVEYEPNDLTVAVQGGMRFGALREQLGSHGQMLPLDVADPEHATIGGLFAAGIAGPRRYGYGSLRDLVIGVTTVLPDGRLSKGGGMVVKNVSGFDMMRLHYGALGSLGIVVQLNFKVLPRPRAQQTVLARFARLDDALEAAMTIRASQLGPTAIIVVDSGAMLPRETSFGWLLALRGEAPPAAAERQAERFRGAIGSAADDLQTLDEERTEDFWNRASQILSAATAQHEIGLRIGVQPSGILALMRQLEAAFPTGEVTITRVVDVGSGIVYARVEATPDEVRMLSETWRNVLDIGGHRTLLRAPRALKLWTDVFGSEPEGFAIMRELKRHFDPRSILNRGRFVGRL